MDSVLQTHHTGRPARKSKSPQARQKTVGLINSVWRCLNPADVRLLVRVTQQVWRTDLWCLDRNISYLCAAVDEMFQTVLCLLSRLWIHSWHTVCLTLGALLLLDSWAGRSHCGVWTCEAAGGVSSSTCPVSRLQDGWSRPGDGVFLSASKITRVMNLFPFVDTSIDRSLVHHQSLYTHILTQGALKCSARLHQSAAWTLDAAREPDCDSAGCRFKTWTGRSPFLFNSSRRDRKFEFIGDFSGCLYISVSSGPVQQEVVITATNTRGRTCLCFIL